MMREKSEEFTCAGLELDQKLEKFSGFNYCSFLSSCLPSFILSLEHPQKWIISKEESREERRREMKMRRRENILSQTIPMHFANNLKQQAAAAAERES
jgi:hypothetical protein